MLLDSVTRLYICLVEVEHNIIEAVLLPKRPKRVLPKLNNRFTKTFPLGSSVGLNLYLDCSFLVTKTFDKSYCHKSLANFNCLLGNQLLAFWCVSKVNNFLEKKNVSEHCPFLGRAAVPALRTSPAKQSTMACVTQNGLLLKPHTIPSAQFEKSAKESAENKGFDFSGYDCSFPIGHSHRTFAAVSAD